MPHITELISHFPIFLGEWQKEKLMKKRIIIIIIVVVLAVIVFTLLKGGNRITGREWFDRQQTYVDELETYSDEVADVYLLYFNGNISADDFYNHVTVLQSELSIMKQVRAKELEAHPIKPDTYEYYAKLGCEAVDSAYESYGNLLSASLTNYNDSNQVMYDYLTVKSDMKNIMWDYALAVSHFEAVDGTSATDTDPAADTDSDPAMELESTDN